MEERYLSVGVFSDPREADVACCCLEESGISVIIQHLVVEPQLSSDQHTFDLMCARSAVADYEAAPDGISAVTSTQELTRRSRPLRAAAFRLLVPMASAQTALQALKRRALSRLAHTPLQAA